MPTVSWTVSDPWSNKIGWPQQQCTVHVWGWAWVGAEGRNKFLYVASQTPMTHIFIQHVFFSTTHSMPLGRFPKVNWRRGRNRGWVHRWAYENIVVVIWILKNHNLTQDVLKRQCGDIHQLGKSLSVALGIYPLWSENELMVSMQTECWAVQHVAWKEQGPGKGDLETGWG